MTKKITSSFSASVTPPEPATRRDGVGKTSSSKRDPEGTRQRILDAATEEFTLAGLGGARVDQIAKRAGINERMLYYYFGSKEGLFRTALENAYLKLVEAEHSLHLDDLPADEAMRQLMAFIWQYYVDNPGLVNLVNSENLHKARHLKQSECLGELISPTVKMIETILLRGQKAGLFRLGIDPIQLYITIASLGYFHLSNCYTASATLGVDLLSQDMLRAHLEHNTEVVMSFLLKR